MEALVKPDLLKQLFQMRAELHGFIYGVVRDYHVAEDILQDVAVVIAEKAERLPEIREFRAWAKEVARREVLAHLRKRREIAPRVPVDEMVDAIARIYQAHNPPSDELADELEALEECLGRSPERSRRIMRMRLAEGRSFPAIARLLEMTEAAVRQVISRTRRALAECVERKLGPVERSAR